MPSDRPRWQVRDSRAVLLKQHIHACAHQGSDQLTPELFVKLLKRMMRGRKRAVHLIVDGLAAHKTLAVRDYIASTRGRLTMHVLPGYAPDLNPDELVWSYVKRTGVARNPLRAGEKPEIRIDQQLQDVKKNRRLVRSFFKTPSVS